MFQRTLKQLLLFKIFKDWEKAIKKFQKNVEYDIIRAKEAKKYLEKMYLKQNMSFRNMIKKKLMNYNIAHAS